MDSSTGNNVAQTPTDNELLKQEILDSLDAIQARGNFATIRHLNVPYHDPGLQPPEGKLLSIHGYDGYGGFAAPLGDYMANPIITDHAMPNTQFHDNSPIRNTFWELDTTQFEEHAHWARYVQDIICPRVVQELGIHLDLQPLVRTEMCKLVLQDKGPMRDPKVQIRGEPGPGVFGTLIFTMPSTHDGGDIIFAHGGGKDMVYRTMDTGEQWWSYAAWYSDVPHEVLPLTNGHRALLVYNLVLQHPTSTLLSAAGLSAQPTEQLRNALAKWLTSQSNPGSMNCLYYALDHTYHRHSYWPSALRSRDRACAQILEDLAQEHDLPFEVFISLVEKDEHGRAGLDPRLEELRLQALMRKKARKLGLPVAKRKPVKVRRARFHRMVEVERVRYTVEGVCDMNGIQAFPQDDGLELGNFLQPEPFKLGERDELEYGKYGATWLPSATHRYDVTTLVLVPHCRLPEYWRRRGLGALLSPTNTCRTSTFAWLTQPILRGCNRPVISQMLISACSARPDGSPSPILAQQEIVPGGSELILAALLTLGEIDLFHELIAQNRGYHLKLFPTFFVWARKWVHDERFDSAKRFAQIRPGLDALLEDYEDNQAERIEALAFFAPRAMPSDRIPELGPWIEEKLLEGLRGRLLNPETVNMPMAVSTLTEVLHYLPDSRVVGYFSNVILPMIDFPRYQPASMFLQLFDVLHFEMHNRHCDRRLDSKATAIQLFKLASSFFLKHVDFAAMEPERKDPETHDEDETLDEDQPPDEDLTAISPDSFAMFFKSLVMAHCEDVIDGEITPEDTTSSAWAQFIDVMCSQADRLSSKHFESMWMPLLDHSLEDYSDALEEYPSLGRTARKSMESMQRSLILTLFKSLGTRYIGRGCRAEQRKNRFHELMDTEFNMQDPLVELVGEELFHVIVWGGGKTKFFGEDDVGGGGLLRQRHPVKFKSKRKGRPFMVIREKDGKEERRVDYSWEAEPVRSVKMEQDIFSALDSLPPCGSYASLSVDDHCWRKSPSDLKPPYPPLPRIKGYGHMGSKNQDSEVGELVKKYAMPRSQVPSQENKARNTLWKLDTTQFDSSVPWQNHVQGEICPRVCLDFGIEAHVADSVKAKIRNIVLQQAGPMCDPEVKLSSETDPAIFGTLVVSRHSSHIGGDILLTHHHNQIVYSTERKTKESCTKYSYAAWSNKANHQISPLIRGTRIMMVFDLILDSHHFSVRGPSTAEEQLTVSLRRWLESRQPQTALDPVCYPLEYAYDWYNNVPTLYSLRPRDRARLQVLMNLSNGPDLPFEVLVTSLGKTKRSPQKPKKRTVDAVSGSEQELKGLDEELKAPKKNHVVGTVFDMHGAIMFTRATVTPSHTELENDVEREDENEQHSLDLSDETAWFNTTALVLVPRLHLTPPPFEPPVGTETISCPSNLLCYLGRMIVQGRECPERTLMFILGCSIRDSDNNPSKALRGISRGQDIADVLKATLHLKQYDLFNNMVKLRYFNKGAPIKHLPLDFFAWVRMWVKGDIRSARERFARIQDGLGRLIMDYEDWRDDPPNYRLSSSTPPSSPVEALAFFVPPVKAPGTMQIRLWTEDILQQCFRLARSSVWKIGGEMTVSLLIHLTFYVPHGSVLEYLRRFFVGIPKYSLRVHAERFTCYLGRLRKEIEDGDAFPSHFESRETAIRLFNAAAMVLLDAIDFFNVDWSGDTYLRTLWYHLHMVHCYDLQMHLDSTPQACRPVSPWVCFSENLALSLRPRDGIRALYLVRATSTRNMQEDVPDLYSRLSLSVRADGRRIRWIFVSSVVKSLAASLVGGGCGAKARAFKFCLEVGGLLCPLSEYQDELGKDLYEAIMQRKLIQLLDDDPTLGTRHQLPRLPEVTTQRHGRVFTRVKRRKSGATRVLTMKDYSWEAEPVKSYRVRKEDCAIMGGGTLLPGSGVQVHRSTDSLWTMKDYCSELMGSNS
ncbi:hypothetical protein QBC41DRAFT_380695 [Cercophora samala]|uniref:Uncharacterized protein n=1 Tax=Cercophora samala TaxID=330535 RepID=A0AA40D7I1_9PEZI|nr:hypothetical protein QBC41DRAFT_380695 [Cercophora samala]